jgi:hypothetical protein
MSTVEQIESAIEQLPRQQMREIQDWLGEMLEDGLEFTDEFKASIERGKQDVAEGRIRSKN